MKGVTFGLAFLEWVGCQHAEMGRESVFTKQHPGRKSAEGFMSSGHRHPLHSLTGWVLFSLPRSR